MNRRDVLKAFFGGLLAAPAAVATGAAVIVPDLVLPLDQMLGDWLIETLKGFEAQSINTEDCKTFTVRYRQKAGWCNVNDMVEKFCAGKKPQRWTASVMHKEFAQYMDIEGRRCLIPLAVPEVFLDVVYE
jgi:hypothetical protein